MASLHLDCLDVDENGKAVLVYDNHKAGRMGRRLPVTDTDLVQAIRDQQRWVAERFPDVPRNRLWLLPRPTRNAAGTTHIGAGQLYNWLRAWVAAIPRIDAGPADEHGEPIPFPRSAITPHAFRHTYAQTLADQGVPAPVLRDLMDHHHMNTTLGYYRVGETKKREAMELLARHTVDNRGTTRPALGQASRTGQLARAAVVGGGPDGQVLRARQRPIRRAGLPDPLPVRRLPPFRIGPLLPARAGRLRRRSAPRTGSVAGHRGRPTG